MVVSFIRSFVGMFDTLFVGGRRAGWLAGSLGCFRDREIFEVWKYQCMYRTVR